MNQADINKIECNLHCLLTINDAYQKINDDLIDYFSVKKINFLILVHGYHLGTYFQESVRSPKFIKNMKQKYGYKLIRYEKFENKISSTEPNEGKTAYYIDNIKNPSRKPFFLTDEIRDGGEKAAIAPKEINVPPSKKSQKEKAPLSITPEISAKPPLNTSELAISDAKLQTVDLSLIYNSITNLGHKLETVNETLNAQISVLKDILKYQTENQKMNAELNANLKILIQNIHKLNPAQEPLNPQKSLDSQAPATTIAKSEPINTPEEKPLLHKSPFQSNTQKFLCWKCNVEFPSNHALVVHYPTCKVAKLPAQASSAPHKPLKKAKSVKCHKCNRKFKTADALKQHNQAIHK